MPAYDAIPEEPEAPARISALAVSSFVFALLCCIPGVGLIAVILGISALLRIRSAEGRLGGKTLAIIAIALGAIGTLGWLMVGLGARQFYAAYDRGIAQPAYAAMRAMEGKDWTAARTLLDPKASAQVSDADLAAFADAYHTRFGAFKGTATHVDFSLLFAPQPANVPPHAGVVPIPADFQNDPGVIFLVTDSPTVFNDVLQRGASIQGTASNILIVGKSKHLWLIDPQRTTGTPAPTAPTAPTGPRSPSGP